jgi:hypothetical protein
MHLAKKPDKADPNEARLSRCTYCSLSGEPLAAPAIADLPRETVERAVPHVQFTRDFFDPGGTSH